MNPRGLYLPDGSFLDFADKPARAVLLAEVATRASAGGMSLGLGLLPDPDPVLRKRGDGAGVLEELTADDMVCTAIQTRKLKTLNRSNFEFRPGTAPGQEPDKAAQALCDALVADLERLDLYVLFGEVLDAPYHGFSPIELSWAAEGGRLRLVNAQAKPRTWFGFDDENRFVFRAGLGGEPQVPPPGKFLLARHFPSYDNPYGLRLLSRCLWPVAFKKGGVQFWLNFAEKFGTPWVVGKTGQGGNDGERQRTLNALLAMVQSAVAVVSGGTEVEIVEPAGKAGDLHRNLVVHWDQAISRILMGQTLTASEGAEHGTQALGQTHYAVLGDFAEADERLLCAAMDELAWTYGQVNEPGVLAPTFGFVEPEDHAARAELDTRLHGCGVDFTPVHFERAYGLAEDEFTLRGSKPEEDGKDAKGKAKEFAEGAAGGAGYTPEQQALEDLVAAVLPEAEAAQVGLAGRLAEVIRRAESWDDLAILLAEELAAPEADRFSDLLESTVLAADMWGRFTSRSRD